MMMYGRDSRMLVCSEIGGMQYVWGVVAPAKHNSNYNNISF